jgi:hypothetical protein
MNKQLLAYGDGFNPEIREAFHSFQPHCHCESYGLRYTDGGNVDNYIWPRWPRTLNVIRCGKMAQLS